MGVLTPGPEDCPEKRIFSELQKQFGKESFFQLWYYMDFDASRADTFFAINPFYYPIWVLRPMIL
jgi:hypothetical protein